MHLASNCSRFTLLFLLLGFQTVALRAQHLSEDTLGDNFYSLILVDKKDEGPKKAIYMLETTPKRTVYRMVRALYCKDSTLAFNSYHTPESCVIWAVEQNSKDRITQINEDGSRTVVNPEDIDSTKSIDKACLQAFYAADNDSVQVDTIFVERNNLAYNTDLFISQCNYVNGRKHGGEVTYYENWELKGQCISNYKRIKSTGAWEKGKQTGWWKYYDVNGTLVKTTLFKKGKVKETRVQAE